MKYKRATIASDEGDACMIIAIGEDGSVHVRTTGDIKFKPDSTNVSKDIIEAFKDIVNNRSSDVPLGESITYRGVEYVCVKAQDDDSDCDGCALKDSKKCVYMICSKEERADRTDIIFIRRT